MVIDSLQYNGPCTCGRSHRMETELCVVESGCLKKLNDYLDKCGLTGCTAAVYDENTYRATADRHPCVSYEIVLPSEGLHADERSVALLQRQLPSQVQLIIAVGAGSIHDIVRYCAYHAGVAFVSCPTAASVDGFCASVAAMTWHGCKKTMTAAAPRIVIADTDIIRRAPIYLAKSGFGDMVGKYVSLTEWTIGHLLTGEFYCRRIADMTRNATEAVVLSAQGILRSEEAAYENLMYGLLLSGLAMQMMGNSRPASGAEHHISHMIEMEPAGLGVRSDALHGEKVGVGTLLAMEEYRRLADLAEPVFRDYAPYTEAEIRALFAHKTEELLLENAKDAASGITAQTLRANWEAICREIRSIPDVESLRQLYETLGVKSRLPDIQVPEDAAAELLRCSPMVRNRLTLMRLRKCLVQEEA